MTQRVFAEKEGCGGRGMGNGEGFWEGGGLGRMVTRQDKAKEGLKGNAAAVVGDSTPPKGKGGNPTSEESRQTNLQSQFSV